MKRLLRWLQRFFAGDLYSVWDGNTFIDYATSLQGAELIRIDEARRLAATDPEDWPTEAHQLGVRTFQQATAFFYQRLRIENHNVQDED